MNNIIDMSQVTQTPFTREEATALIVGLAKAETQIITEKIDNYFNQRAAEAGNLTAELTNKYNSVLRNIIEQFGTMYNEQQNAFSELISSMKNVTQVSPVNVAPVALIQPQEVMRLREESSAFLNELCDELKLDLREVCKQVYKEIKRVYGIDVLVIDRGSQKSVLSMCMNDPNLLMYLHETAKHMLQKNAETRKSAEAQAASSPVNYSSTDITDVKKKAKKIYPSWEVQTMPAEIAAECKALYPKLGTTYSFQLVLGKMREISHMDINLYIKEHASEMKYKNFCRSYFINNNPVLKQIFLEAVAALKKEQCVA